MKKKSSETEVARFLDAWFAVRQLIQAANFNRFQSTDLSATQFMTLNLLPSEGEGIAIGELARKMNLKPATVAKTVDSLESRKMVTRQRSDTDQRRVLVAITKSGSELQNSASGRFKEQMSGLFGEMPSGEREGLILGLESLVRAASRRLDLPPDRAIDGRDDLRARRSTKRSRPA